MATPVNVTYSVASGLPIYGGRSSSPHSAAPGVGALAITGYAPTVTQIPSDITVALVGDSLTDDSFGLETFTWMNAVAGGKLQYVFNCGISGDTVANVISRIDNAYNASPRGLASFPVVFGYVVVRIGTNDARAGTAIAGTLTTQYATLMAKLATYAEKVIVLSVPPLAASAGNTLTLAYNAHLAATYNSGQFMYVADDTALRDGSGNQISSFFNVDGIHYNESGTCQSGRTGGADAAYLALISGYPSPLVTNPLDVYPAQDQWVTHPTMDGTGGTPSGGVTGTITTGYTASGLTAVGSVVAADGGDPNQVPWQRITINSASASAQLVITPTLAGRAVSGSVPSWLEQIIEWRFVAFDTTHVTSLQYEARIGSDFAAPTMTLKTLGSGTLSLNAVARQKLMRVGASTASLVSHLFANIDGTGFGSTIGAIDYRCVSLRG